MLSDNGSLNFKFKEFNMCHIKNDFIVSFEVDGSYA